MEGRLHCYQSRRLYLNIFEYVQSPETTTTPPNILLFVGGLFDNFQNPSYVNDLGRLFPRHRAQKWAVMHIQLSSAMHGFGVTDLNDDIDEIATGVKYIRDVIRKGQPEATNIVLMGHSTGCQDLLHYLYSPNPTTPKTQPRPAVQGAIFQAPVSDREAVMVLKVNVDPAMRARYDKCLKLIETIPEEEHRSYMMPFDWTKPLFGRAPLCISRFLDFASPSSPDKPRIDDLFSHDLHESRLNETFGNVGVNGLLQHSKSDVDESSVLMLFSSDDEQISTPFKASDLMSRWSKALASNPQKRVSIHTSSTLIENAWHDISGDRPEEQYARLVVMRQAVLKYLNDVVGGIDDVARDLFDQDANRVNSLLQDAGEMDRGLHALKL